jgi:hypothetical protein
MNAIPEYNRTPVKYDGCTEGWAREFDPIVRKLVEQAVGRHGDGTTSIHGKNITEFSIDEFAGIIADVMLRTILYSGWRDLLNINAAVAAAFQDTHTPARSESTPQAISAVDQTKNQHDSHPVFSQCVVTPQSLSAGTPSPNETKCKDGLEGYLRNIVREVVLEYIQSTHSAG